MCCDRLHFLARPLTFGCIWPSGGLCGLSSIRPFPWHFAAFVELELVRVVGWQLRRRRYCRLARAAFGAGDAGLAPRPRPQAPSHVHCAGLPAPTRLDSGNAQARECSTPVALPAGRVTRQRSPAALCAPVSTSEDALMDYLNAFW